MANPAHFSLQPRGWRDLSQPSHPVSNLQLKNPRASGGSAPKSGTLVCPVTQGSDSLQLTAMTSHTVVQEALASGPLSMQEQMRTQRMIRSQEKKMIEETDEMVREVRELYVKFDQDFQAVTKKAQTFLTKETERLIQSISSHPKDAQQVEVETSALNSVLILFANMGTQVKNNFTSAMEELKLKHGQTQTAYQEDLRRIFENRSKEVQLFGKLLETLHIQEVHQLTQVLQIEEAKLKRDAQLFSQMKEVAAVEASLVEAEHRRGIELLTIDHQYMQTVNELALKQLQEQNEHSRKTSQITLTAEFQNKQLESQERMALEQMDTKKKLGLAQVQVQKEIAISQAELASQTAIYAKEIDSRTKLALGQQQAQTSQFQVAQKKEEKQLHLDYLRQRDESKERIAKEKMRTDQTTAIIKSVTTAGAGAAAAGCSVM